MRGDAAMGTVTVVPDYGTPVERNGYSGVADTPNGDAMDSMGERELLVTILTELRELRTAHNEMVTKVNSVIDEFAPHIPRITELVDSVANSPVMKMFGGKK